MSNMNIITHDYLLFTQRDCCVNIVMHLNFEINLNQNIYL